MSKKINDQSAPYEQIGALVAEKDALIKTMKAQRDFINKHLRSAGIEVASSEGRIWPNRRPRKDKLDGDALVGALCELIDIDDRLGEIGEDLKDLLDDQ